MISLQSCILRPWQWSDRNNLALHANNRNISINLRDSFPWPYTLDDADAFLNLAVGQTLTRFAAIEINGEAVGGIGLESFYDVNRFGSEIGYWLSEKYWGKGIMSEVLRAYTSYVFQNTELVRLEALVFSWNRSSVTVLERCGYGFEGRLKKACFKADQWCDQLIYAKLKE
ncbi:MAG: GNAT family N-acetyltransferase [Bacteroidia bacterium]|nr:GNAT family N-acetyltransferase [Bacteroidia bacterium]